MKEKHNHNQCIEDALQHVEALCNTRSIKLTPIRREVLLLVWQSHKAIKAYDILEQLNKYSAKPPTVYRALNFLQEQGFIHKIESLNAYTGCPNPQIPHQGFLLICDYCGNISELYEPEIATKIEAQSHEQNFIIQKTVIEIHGICENCQQRGK